jgi:hypothetical protein
VLRLRPIPDVSIPTLQDAIRNLHGCYGVWVESVPVTETLNGQIVWDGEVQVFDLPGYVVASRCYAWSRGVDDSDRRRFFVLLHKPPINSPQAAVRAAIVQEYRQRLDR